MKNGSLEVQAQSGAELATVATLQEGVLDGHEVEGLVLGAGQVASPQLQAVMGLFPGD